MVGSSCAGVGSDPGTNVSLFASQIIVQDLWRNPLPYYKRKKPPGEGEEHTDGQVRTRGCDAGGHPAHRCAN